MTVRELQWQKLRRLLAIILPANPFYRARLPRKYKPKSLTDFVTTCPLLTKADLARDRAETPPFGTNLTWRLERYTRFCQTSGTTGRPLSWLDTPEDWGAMLRCWHRVFEKAGLDPRRDRIFFAFSFGPFLGFWTAFEAAVSMGFLSMPGGSLSTNARLQTIVETSATVLCCTPTYAIRLGEARAEQDLTTTVRLVIVAGEAGGSIPATRQRIERLWPGSKVFDHHGLTEAGPVTHEEPGWPGRLRVIEQSYFAEVIEAQTSQEVEEGEAGELVLTTLDRAGCPLLRFRTGDRVVKALAEDGGLCLDGGILNRYDDMVVVRGVNVYPSAIEGVLRRFQEIAEYQVREDWSQGMLELRLVVELVASASADLPRRIEAGLQDALGLRIPIEVFPLNSLPRFEFKSRRWIRAPMMGETVGGGFA
ncbi:MAG: phenylacetate--CoA ligase family protein [Verrucomicrobiales bacterium]